jgi:formate dehydrogenase subunit beta
MELFRTVSYHTQKAFEYEAGRSIEEDLPLSVFREDELAEVVGIGNHSNFRRS